MPIMNIPIMKGAVLTNHSQTWKS